MKIHLYYDAEKAARESEDLYDLIDAQENELSSMEEPPDRKLRYDRYFFINRSKEGKLGFTKNHGAIDEALAQCGFFAIAETDFTKDDAEILEIYCLGVLDFVRILCYNGHGMNLSSGMVD